MAKSPISNRIRLTLLKGMEAVGTTASNMASNAKLRANEINLENKRREILSNFNLRAFELWQKGETLPQPLADMLVELSEIDDRLSVLRAQKYAKVVQPECACAPDTSEAADAAEAEAAADTTDESIPTDCAVSDDEGSEAQPVDCALQENPPAQDAADHTDKP
jgi:hypothetical protein